MSLEIYNAVFNGEYPKAIVLSVALGTVSLIIFVLLRCIARPASS
jgi:molybdate transport system permease protein